MVVVLWIFFCFLVGMWAQNWGRSFGSYFVLSLFLSPIVGAIVLAVKGEVVDGEVVETKDKITSTISNVTHSGADEIKKYKELLDSGVITEEEFEKKKKQILNI